MLNSIEPVCAIRKRVRKFFCVQAVLAGLASFFAWTTFAQIPEARGNPPVSSGSLETLATDFWEWRARYQPFSNDDIPRIEHRPGPRDWSAAAITKQNAELSDFETRWKALDTSGWSVPRQVDYRLIGSALARVHWELDVNQRWLRDPSFYVEQTLTALAEALLQPAPFDAARSQVILQRMEEIPAILDDGRANLRPVRPFAELAIADLDGIRPKLSRVQRDLAPRLKSGASGGPVSTARFADATEKAIVALESYRAWLRDHLNGMPDNSGVGRAGYEFFLRKVALLPYTPEELLFLSRQEWNRSVAFETYEKESNRGIAELPLASSSAEEIARVQRDELTIRKFLDEKGILTVPADLPHYSARQVPDYLSALSDFVETDDFASASRQKDDGIRWIDAPSPQLGYFWLAMAKDPRPEIVHEGVPGHFFQLAISRRNPDPIRRYYYDSGANEGIGFYSEEMMLQEGLFGGSPRTREMIYNFLRLRALRVEVDVKLALGEFTLSQAGDYLATHVPMDKKSALEEAALFATTPGQAISYMVGKAQILQFLADTRLAEGDKFSLRKFDDFLWLNGNVPIVLQQWEYLGKDDDLRAVDKLSQAQPFTHQ
jgi:hypothetical protein